jgi:hypothetical protein
MFSSPSCCVGLILVVLYSSCAESHVNVRFYRIGGYEFSSSEQSVIQTIIDATTVEVGQMLPTLPASLSLRVQPGQDVDPDTGEAATPSVPDVVYWTVSPTRAGGVSAIARAQLRATLFHPFCYLARRAAIGPVDRLKDEVISMGLATVFARDFGGRSDPWGAYPLQVDAWVHEVLALPDDARRDQWMDRHPDGRRWIGPKVGTYLVDRAVRASGRSVTDLVSAATDDIIRIALER